jgi:hypothetical protein
MSVISTDGKTGTPLALDKNHTVYYKGNGVTKIDAAHVGGFFKGYGYFGENNHSDVQIFSAKPGDAVDVGFIIGGKDVSPETATYFKNALQGLQEFFPGRVLNARLMDTELKVLRVL